LDLWTAESKQLVKSERSQALARERTVREAAAFVVREETGVQQPQPAIGACVIPWDRPRSLSDGIEDEVRPAEMTKELTRFASP
jgi:hypothetical protein